MGVLQSYEARPTSSVQYLHPARCTLMNTFLFFLPCLPVGVKKEVKVRIEKMRDIEYFWGMGYITVILFAIAQNASGLV